MADLDVVEICAGAGGQALGLERAGFEHALAVELDSSACGTLRANRPAWKVAEGDVADRDLWRPEDYRDTFTDKVKQLVEDKRAGNEVITESAPPAATDVTDLLEALRLSVEARRAS